MSEEENIELIESLVPGLSATAISLAYTDAINHGLSVYICDFEGETIVEILPNGEKKIIKKITKPTRITPGTTFEIA